MKKQQPKKNPKSRALRLLTMRDYTRYELSKKLDQDGFPTEEIEAVIQWLQGLGYLNDEKTAAAWVEYRNRFRPTGVYGLKHELQQKGVAAEIIDKVMNSSQLDTELALGLARTRLEALSKLPPRKQYQRIGGLLSRRGFSWPVIVGVLNALFDSSLDSDLQKDYN